MSYPFPYALGVCLATLAALAATVAAVGMITAAAADYFNRPHRARLEREAAAHRARLAAEARLRRCGDTVQICFEREAEAAEAHRELLTCEAANAFLRAREIRWEAEAAFDLAKANLAAITAEARAAR